MVFIKKSISNWLLLFNENAEIISYDQLFSRSFQVLVMQQLILLRGVAK